MSNSDSIYIGSRTGSPDDKETLKLKYANRHGLVAGATGTGKTVTLQGLAEGFSKAGVPVFLSDIKGDLSGMAEVSQMEDFLVKRAEIIGLDGYEGENFPVVFWDMFGEQGHPVRTTITEMGPLLLSRMMGLNETQEGVLNIAFRVAEEEDMLLLDLKDLQSLLVNIGERSKELALRYGNVSSASVGAIQRRLLTLENQGGEHFFGEPALDIKDLMRTDSSGKGNVNILASDKLIQSPALYATFLFWLLSELFEELPEAGDMDKPKLVFFFDEAHLLFKDAPKALLEKIEQVVRLIRSKAVGVYFITQSPTDIPDSVGAQLASRVQHALRAFTPKAQKDVRVAAETFRPNPELDTAQVITELGVGEALVSTLEKKGVPSMVQRTLVRPPYSRLGPAGDGVRERIIEASLFGRMYNEEIDRESAYEILKKRREERAKKLEEEKAQEAEEKAKGKTEKKKSRRQGPVEAFFMTVVRTAARAVSRELMKVVFGKKR